VLDNVFLERERKINLDQSEGRREPILYGGLGIRLKGGSGDTDNKPGVVADREKKVEPGPASHYQRAL